ncbi:MAG TPA: lysylphosphatidylglycerol synthase domain-containing protein, partial [Burkholderiales bacterium]|nr:lysylphosphatidylglycerol synthase domain-containing protein [Burkholderiales bacterium]
LALESLLLMMLVSLPWLFTLVRPAPARWAVGAIILAGALALAVLLAVTRFRRWLEPWRVTRVLVKLSSAAQQVFWRPGTLVWIVALTIGSYALASLVVHLLARGLGVDLPLGEALLLVPLVTLVSVLPISIAGWGVRESAMVVALGLIGVPAAAAFSLSVLYGLVIMATGIPGGVLWLMQRHRAAPEMNAA